RSSARHVECVVVGVELLVVHCTSCGLGPFGKEPPPRVSTPPRAGIRGTGISNRIAVQIPLSGYTDARHDSLTGPSPTGRERAGSPHGFEGLDRSGSVHG